MDEKRLLELNEYYKHKRNRHKMNSNHYWRYNGKIEAINDIIQELKGNKVNFGTFRKNKDRAISEQR